MEPIPVGEKVLDGEKEVGVLTSMATDRRTGRPSVWPFCVVAAWSLARS